MIPGNRNPPSAFVAESFSAPVSVLISLSLASVIAALDESCTRPVTLAALNCANARTPIQKQSRSKHFNLVKREKTIITLGFIGFAPEYSCQRPATVPTEGMSCLPFCTPLYFALDTLSSPPAQNGTTKVPFVQERRAIIFQSEGRSMDKFSLCYWRRSCGGFALILLTLVFCGGVCGRALKTLRNPRRVQQLCPGCGRFAGQKHENATAQDLATACPSAGATTTLCSDCEFLVHRLRQDSRIAALFAFSQGRKRKYYAAFRIPTL